MRKIETVDLSMFGGMILFFLGHPGFTKWNVSTECGDEVLAETFLQQDFLPNVFSQKDIEFVKRILNRKKDK